MLPETVWICKLWDRTVLEVLAKERRDKELPIESILSLEWSLVLYFTFRNHCGSMWLLSMFLSSYDTDASNMTHRAFMIFASSKIECLGRDWLWLIVTPTISRQTFTVNFPRAKTLRFATWQEDLREKLGQQASRLQAGQSTVSTAVLKVLLSRTWLSCCNSSYLLHTLFISYSYFMYALLHTGWLFGSLFTLKNVNDSTGFSSNTIHELMFATDVLCAQGPRKRARSQSTEGSGAGGPFLA